MSYPNSIRIRELWLKMKAYINNRIETLEQGVTMKLLWENPNSTAEFIAQTISLDLSEYDGVQIFYRKFISYAQVKSETVLKGNTTDLYEISGIKSDYVNADPGYIFHMARMVSEVSNAGVKFEHGRSAYATTPWYDDDRGCIPYKIYGIKGVQNG